MAKIYNLVCDGNSITAGFGLANQDDGAWPPLCRGLLITDQASHAQKYWSVKSIAVSGATTPARTAAIAADLAPLYSPNYAMNVVTFFEAVNDFVTNGASVVTAQNNIIAYTAAARALGFKVAQCTPTPTNNTGGQANVRVPLIAQWLRDNPSLSDFTLIDLAANASLSNPSNLTFYQADGLHPTDAGAAVIAGLVHDLIVTL